MQLVLQSGRDLRRGPNKMPHSNRCGLSGVDMRDGMRASNDIHR